MKVTEITDYSIVIMKDSEDKPWLSLTEIKDQLDLYSYINLMLLNFDNNNTSYNLYNGKDFEAVCNGRILILLMKDNTESIIKAINLKVGSSVGIMVFGKLYGGLRRQ